MVRQLGLEMLHNFKFTYYGKVMQLALVKGQTLDLLFLKYKVFKLLGYWNCKISKNQICLWN